MNSLSCARIRRYSLRENTIYTSEKLPVFYGRSSQMYLDVCNIRGREE